MRRLLILNLVLVALGLVAGATVGCGRTPSAPVAAATWIPGDTSLRPLGPVAAPPDNPTTPEKVELGRLLYFDQRLSGDRSTSCATCHIPGIGWGTGTDISPGYPGTKHWRNSQTVVNSAYLAKFFWAGEATSLESQANSAVTGILAGNGDPVMIEERLYQVPEYRRRFKEVFGDEVPRYAWILKAISAFERTIVTRDLPYDRFLAGDPEALSAEARRGFEVFTGKGRCATCHNGMNLTDEDFHALGVPQNPAFRNDPMVAIAVRYQHYARGTSDEVYRGASRDEGLFYTTLRDEDRGRFRTPPLRYVGHTGPYMHNGVFATLQEVVDFYDRGGGTAGNRDPLLRPLGLTDEEKTALIAFMTEALTGPEILVEAPPIPVEEAIP